MRVIEKEGWVVCQLFWLTGRVCKDYLSGHLETHKCN